MTMPEIKTIRGHDYVSLVDYSRLDDRFYRVLSLANQAAVLLPETSFGGSVKRAIEELTAALDAERSAENSPPIA